MLRLPCPPRMRAWARPKPRCGRNAGGALRLGRASVAWEGRFGPMFSNTVWTFWDVFFLMFIWIPLLVVWVAAIFDVFTRRALSGWAKAAWLLAIVILPFVGTLLYVIFRPWNEA